MVYHRGWDEGNLSRSWDENDLATIQSEIEDYTIYLSILDENTALVVIFPSLANKGLVEVEIENARRKLLQIFGENE